MDIITETKNLSYSKWIYKEGLLDNIQHGSYDRDWGMSLSVRLSDACAYKSDGTYDKSHSGEQSVGDNGVYMGKGISGFYTELPIDYKVSEYWRIKMEGSNEVETLFLNDLPASCATEYYKSHIKFEPVVRLYQQKVDERTGDLYWDEVSNGFDKANSFVRISANRNDDGKMNTYKVSISMNNGTPYEVDVIQGAQTWEWYNGNSDKSYVDVQYNNKFIVDHENGVFNELPPSNGNMTLMLYPHLYTETGKNWEDGLHESAKTTARDTKEIVIVTRNATVYAKQNTATEWQCEIPANTVGDTIRIGFSNEDYGVRYQYDLVQTEVKMLAPEIQRYSVDEIPASGGSVSSCVVYYNQYDTLGVNHPDHQTVYFAAVSGDPLGTDSHPKPELKGTIRVKVTANGIESGYSFVNVYQEANTYTESTDTVKAAEYGKSSTVYNTPSASLTYGLIPAKGGEVSPSASCSQTKTVTTWDVTAVTRPKYTWTSGSVSYGSQSGGTETNKKSSTTAASTAGATYTYSKVSGSTEFTVSSSGIVTFNDDLRNEPKVQTEVGSVKVTVNVNGKSDDATVSVSQQENLWKATSGLLSRGGSGKSWETYEYGTPSVSLSYGTIPAGGGSVTASVTYSQTNKTKEYYYTAETYYEGEWTSGYPEERIQSTSVKTYTGNTSTATVSAGASITFNSSYGSVATDGNVSATSLGTTENTAETTIAKVKATVNLNGKSGSSSEVSVKQAVNQKHVETIGYTATFKDKNGNTIDNSKAYTITSDANSINVVVSASTLTWYDAIGKSGGTTSTTYPSGMNVYQVLDSTGAKTNYSQFVNNSYIVPFTANKVGSSTTSARSFTVYAYNGTTYLAQLSVTQSGYAPTEYTVKLMSSGTTFYVINQLSYKVKFRVLYKISASGSVQYYPTSNGLDIEAGATSTYFGNTQQWGSSGYAPTVQTLNNGTWGAPPKEYK